MSNVGDLNGCDIDAVAKNLINMGPITYIRNWAEESLFEILRYIDHKGKLSELNSFLLDAGLVVLKEKWKGITRDEYKGKFGEEPSPVFGKPCYVVKPCCNVNSDGHFSFKL